MAKRPFHCEACAQITEHLVEETEDEGEQLALCSRCGRIQIVAPEEDKPQPATSQPMNSRTR